MRSRDEEYAALLELNRQAEVYRAPDAAADLEQHGHPGPAARAEAIPSWQASDPAPLVCMLHRGETMMPGNRLGTCADCGLPVQYRPSVPRAWVKLCVFCALALTGCPTAKS
jgi:hypothetical protein